MQFVSRLLSYRFASQNTPSFGGIASNSPPAFGTGGGGGGFGAAQTGGAFGGNTGFGGGKNALP